ncbi:hypothetical protein SeLEV6574_g07607 [Synchytrium endobioticum]|nr:hypothetical protein SeLEV6574_g07607 [Synchytrium endobioticum]
MNMETITEHLGFAPSQLIDDVINSVNELLYQTMTELAKFVDDELLNIGDEENDGNDQEAEHGMTEIETLMENAIDKNFDKFELFVTKNVFAIPPGLNIPSPQYQGLNLNVKPAEEDEIDRELMAVRTRLFTSRMLQRRLESETDFTKQQLGILEIVRNSLLVRIDEIPQQANVSPLLLSVTQLEASIKSMRTAYKNVTGQLSSSDDTTRSTKIAQLVESATKRSQYLTSTIARHMEERRNNVKHDISDGENDAINGSNDEQRKREKRRRSSWAGTGLATPAKKLDCDTEVKEAENIGGSRDIEAFRQLLNLI